MVSMSEWQARKQFIDRTLREVGWVRIERANMSASRDLIVFEEYPTTYGPADYILFYQGHPLAIIEAKKPSVNPQNVLEQAQRYARGLADSPFTFGEFHVPFVYSTNGKQIWFQDLRDPFSRSREVSKFHTPPAMLEMLNPDVLAAKAWLYNHAVDHPLLRQYQKQAIESIEAALQQNRRRMLVAMATGTGKTLTTIALLYRLMKSGYARRILFLVDRRALAAQAVTAFSKFEGEPGLKFDRTYEVYSQRFRRDDLEEQTFDPKVLPTSYLTNPDDTNAFVYVSTIQRMQINLFGQPQEGWASDQDDESDAGVLHMPIHAFDVIVADECHRGYTATEEGKWRQVLNHFDAVKIGLTATPAAHTLAYFENMVYQYRLEQAIREGYLVDYDPIRVHSDLTMKGTFLNPGEEVAIQDKMTGELHYEVLEEERELPASDIDKEWAAPDRDRKVVMEIARYLREQEEERGRFPKTLIFAHNDAGHTSHADRLVNLLRDELNRGDAFVQKITANPNVDRPLQRIREFRNRPTPGIVVTVDMLTTGIDIPALESLVYFRPVWSRILYEQMMGRGTRPCEDIKKTHFVVFDVFGVIEYFAGATDFTPPTPSKPSRSNADVINGIWNNRDVAYNLRLLVSRLQRIAKDISGEGRDLFTRFIPDGDIAGFAKKLPDALKEDWASTMAVLRQPEFQELMANYPRASQPFIIAAGVLDSVTTERLIHLPDGKSVRPDDYLQAFEQFVRENEDTIDALKILLKRPTDWSVEAFGELRQKLRTQPEGFTEERLRRAYQKELADIISLVKHAARGEPLISARERVSRAMACVKEGREFTPKQEHWLELIERHLIENMAIAREDFSLLLFSQVGATWGRVNKDFGGELNQLLVSINSAMAA